MRPSRSSDVMLSLMKIDWSTTVVMVALPPRSRSMAGSSAATALAMSTVLPVLALLTEMPTVALPLVRVMAVSGAGAIFTVATSPRRTGACAVASVDPAAVAAVPAARAPEAAPADAPPMAAADACADGRTRSSSAFSVAAVALTVMG